MVYYLRLKAPVLLAVMAGWSVVMFALVFAMGEQVLPVSASLFVVGWIFQFIGHKMEGKKPSFFEDIQYLWIGPLFVVAWVLSRLRIRW
jgi:uncharacterized membrane protein YGL010W